MKGNWFDGFPTHVELPSVRDWAAAARDRALGLSHSPEEIRTIIAVRGSELASGDLGLLSTPQGRAFVNAVWAADWSAYDTEADRVDFARLAWVMSVFPLGFTLYLGIAEHSYLPIGYTGFYPITKHNYDYLVGGPTDFAHRGQAVPMPEAGRPRYLYVFNYSMVAPLRRSDATRRMLRALRSQLDASPRAGLCAITVSPDGSRVAAKFGMTRRATVAVVGSPDPEYVYGCDESE